MKWPLRPRRRREPSIEIPPGWLDTPLLQDYREFSNQSAADLSEGARAFRQHVAEEWRESGTDFNSRAASFYSQSQKYVFDLLTSRKNYDPQYFEAVSEEYIEHLRGARTVLEFGGGLGSACLWFARQPGVQRVYYYDVAPKHREFARFRFARHDGRGVIRIVDSLDAMPEQVDLIYSDAVIEHVTDPVDSINQLFPALQVGGRLVLLVDVSPDPDGVFPMHRAVDMHAVVLHSVLKTMRPLYEKHRWAYSVWRKEPVGVPASSIAEPDPLRLTFILPEIELWGGVRQVLSLVNALGERGHAVQVIARGERPGDLGAGVEFQSVQDWALARVPPSDFILGTWYSTVPVAVTAANQQPNAVSIHYTQGYEGAFPEQKRHLRDIESAYRLPALKLTPCPKLVGELRLRFGDSTTYLPHFVDSPQFSRGPRVFAEDGNVWILVVGPFETSWKGVATAIRSVELLRRDLPTIRLRRVSQRPLSEAEAALARPDEYHVLVSTARMAELMQASDLFLSASDDEEGFGLPALEALRSGLPCVLSRISSYLNFGPTPQDYALYATVGDSESYAAALRRLVADRELRERIAGSGLETAAPYFDKEAVLDGWEAHLRTLKRVSPQLAHLQRAAKT